MVGLLGEWFNERRCTARPDDLSMSRLLEAELDPDQVDA
jgi:hypothetical protein